MAHTDLWFRTMQAGVWEDEWGEEGDEGEWEYWDEDEEGEDYLPPELDPGKQSVMPNYMVN